MLPSGHRHSRPGVVGPQPPRIGGVQGPGGRTGAGALARGCQGTLAPDRRRQLSDLRGGLARHSSGTRRVERCGILLRGGCRGVAQNPQECRLGHEHRPDRPAGVSVGPDPSGSADGGRGAKRGGRDRLGSLLHAEHRELVAGIGEGELPTGDEDLEGLVPYALEVAAELAGE